MVCRDLACVTCWGYTSLNATGEVVCFSDVTGQDKLELAYMRTGHVS